jgi:hypothetical protein
MTQPTWWAIEDKNGLTHPETLSWHKHATIHKFALDGAFWQSFEKDGYKAVEVKIVKVQS